ncbi:M3 family metallopeptidase [Pseudomonas sp. R5(2019)]|uniref:M3 family metallopeptidase n=1 Tax=Pseudomonas sp. R5(2019) TaxID=2697566 RepID=UPI001412525B|nr:M3 family metallopeptidase [Pseudomonas sp. R5(2019)]NBA96977.1 oligopeptidase A [Pseudomonas sp. R5(2019)]
MSPANPLLQAFDLLPYNAVRVEHLRPAIELIIEENRHALVQIIDSQHDTPTWDGLVLAVADLDKRLGDTVTAIIPLSFRGGEWADAVDDCHGAMTAFNQEKLQNAALYALYRRLAASVAASEEHRATLQRILLDFHLAGGDLAPVEQARFTESQSVISRLEAEFQGNLADATQAWSKLLTDENLLAGIPAQCRAAMAGRAIEQGLEGWLLTLDESTCKAVLAHARHRPLREEIYLASNTRASDQGPNAWVHDNGPVLQALLRLRHEKAQMLGYTNFAQLSLQTKAAQTTSEVAAFLNDLTTSSRPLLLREAEQLRKIAAEDNCHDLQPWDHEFYAQRLREQKGSSDQYMREYFAFESVLHGLIVMTQRLVGVTLELARTDVWDDKVRLLQVSRGKEVLGHIFIDPYARPGKAPWPWSLSMRSRHIDAKGQLTRPVCALFASFAQGRETPALLSHLDMRQLFHEFGHCLHQVLTTASHRRLSNVSGLGRDAGEFPSQLLENWCSSAACLQEIASHYQTGQTTTLESLQRWIEAEHIQGGLRMGRELMLASLDFELHCSAGDGRSIQQIVDQVGARTLALQPGSTARIACSFDYLVTGYEAGYYCYKWAEVYAADAFARFEEEGLFDPEAGRDFSRELLAPGGLRAMSASFEAFRGRAVSARAYLRQNGLSLGD